MKKLLLATAASALMVGAASAQEIKIGIILGFTGPLESITPNMASGAEMAIAEVNAAGTLLDGATVTAVRGDSTCIDAGAATAAGERLVTSDNVNAIMGADSSGVTGAILQNVARPNGVVMISPSATSPARPAAAPTVPQADRLKPASTTVRIRTADTGVDMTHRPRNQFEAVRMPASFSSLVNAPSPCYDADPHRGSGLESCWA